MSRAGKAISMRYRRQERRSTFTSEEAAERIERLRRVYAQGFISKDVFDAMERHVLGCVQRPGTGRAG